MKRFEEIKARDIMQKDVVQFDDAMPIESAIETLEEMEISGAPVVNAVGRLVGVLTKSDISRSAHVRGGKIEAGREWSMAQGDDARDEGEDELLPEDYSPSVLDRETVADWMSPRAITVGPDATLQAVCNRMLAEHIHRLIVVEGNKIEGIITTFDVMRCLAERAGHGGRARAVQAVHRA